MKEISQTRKDYIANIRLRILDELLELVKQDNYKDLERYQYLEEKRKRYSFEYMVRCLNTPERHRQYEELNRAILGAEGRTQESNLLLRRATVDDFSAIFEYEKKKYGNSYVDEVLKISAKDFYSNTASLYCLIYKDPENIMIGYCGINHFFREKIDIAIDFLDEYRRKGYGYEALKQFVQMLRNCAVKGLKELYVYIEVDNIASQHLFEKIGAEFYDVALYDFPKEEIEKYEDTHYYLIDDELETLANKFHIEPRKLLSRVLVYKIEL